MLINRSGAMVLPFLSIYLNQELHFNLTDCGFIMACYGIGSVGGALFGGYLTDKIGYYKVMVSSLFATGIAFVIVMFLKTFWGLCLGIFAISFIADTFRPANLTAIQAFSKPENLTRSIGLVRLAINLGYAIGPFMGGYIASILGYSFLFIFNGLSVCFAGIFFYFLFKNKKKKAVTVLNKEEKKALKMPWLDAPYLLYLVLFMIVVIVFFQIIYIVPLFYKAAYHFDESLVGLLMAMNGLLIFFVEMPLIYKIQDKFKPVTLIFFGGLLIALSVLAFLMIPNPIWASLVFIIFSTFGEMLSFPFSNTFALSFTNDNNRGKYMGFYTMTFSLAHVISPIGWFWYSDNFGYDKTWIFGFLICFIASVGIYLYKLRKA